ncbi:2-nitroimidazole transporter [Vibrio stylophorae]|uniref:2-nitroimidazole transporter n=1 Tax=Vibrio stylophorae TaxID=659351 RepID=A0ABM8ZSF7_9VIBR|nr:MFS transporter [Vibrio stylophorae]CAH0533241.1 2-nitroimidazole transporter [Vibrio stylophorae]
MSQKMSNARIRGRGLVILGILLIASNLRSPIAGMGPVIDWITQDLGLTAAQAGMLTTLPLLAFAFCSPVASVLARRVGLELSLMLALIAILCGVLVRSQGSTPLLFAGTALIGVGIAIGNVLLPSLLKRDFPTHLPTLTALYVLLMGIGSTLVASVAIPLASWAEHMGFTLLPNWGVSLASVLLLVLLAMVVWLPQVRRHSAPTKDTAVLDSHSYLWRTAAAWQVTLFLGINSFVMYILIAWLPSVLIDKGYSEQQAGFLHGLLQLATAIPALALIPLMAKFKDKRWLGGSMAVLTFVGIGGLMLWPQYAVLWILMFGFSCGGGFILGLSFVGIRTHDAQQAAALSGMAQCMGYLLAATGPILFGLLHSVTGSWDASLAMCVLLCLVWGAIATKAGVPYLIDRRGHAHPVAIHAHETPEQELIRLRAEVEKLKAQLAAQAQAQAQAQAEAERDMDAASLVEQSAS